MTSIQTLTQYIQFFNENLYFCPNIAKNGKYCRIFFSQKTFDDIEPPPVDNLFDHNLLHTRKAQCRRKFFSKKLRRYEDRNKVFCSATKKA
jgi:hypothetical protein